MKFMTRLWEKIKPTLQQAPREVLENPEYHAAVERIKNASAELADALKNMNGKTEDEKKG